MYTKLCVLLLAIGMSQAVPQLVMPDLNLMQFMMQTRDLQGNPARSLECFDYYIPILNGYAETYKKEFQQCLDVAEEARLKIDDTTIENRNAINNAANGACEALTECSQLSVATEFFQCYSNQGSNNSKTLYTISANASELLAEVNQEYYLIELSQDTCTNKSERAYIENNNAGIEELNKCVSGLSPVPTAAPESSTAEPESSSAAPESSTAEPESSSAAPESSSAEPESSSAAPESSTAEPESSSAAPESSSAEPESSTAEPESSSAAPESSSAEPESSSAEPESSSAAPESSSESPESSSESPESSSAAPESTTEGQRENLPEEDLSRQVAQEQAKLQQVLQSMRNWIRRQ